MVSDRSNGNEERLMVKSEQSGVCRHCYERRNMEARGLCRPCHSNPMIRMKYDRLSHSRMGHGHSQSRDLRGWGPTCALPGTKEKVAVLEERASRGWPLWHPQDACH